MVHFACKTILMLSGAVVLSIATVAPAHSSYECDFLLHMDTLEPVTMIELRIDYSEVQGRFEKSSRSREGVHPDIQISCTSDVPRTSLVLRDSCDGDYSSCKSGTGRDLAMIITNRHGMRGQEEMVEALGHNELARCTFRSDAQVVADPFKIAIVSAVATGAVPRTPERSPVVTTSIANCVRTASKGDK